MVIESFARRPAALFLSGLLLLAFGLLVYAFERPPNAVPFLPATLSLYDGHAYLPPLLAGPLPTFLHTLAFALMTVALLGQSPRRAGIGCAAWIAVNALFEVSQHPSFHRVFGAGMKGFFDPMDLLAAVLGGVVAFGVVWIPATCDVRQE